MSLANDHQFYFHKGGTTYSYRGYTTAPSGHYRAFKAGDVVRYIPLGANTSGGLCTSIGGTTYSLQRLTSQVRISISASWEIYASGSNILGKTTVRWTTCTMSNGGSLSGISITVRAKNNNNGTLATRTSSLSAEQTSKNLNLSWSVSGIASKSMGNYIGARFDAIITIFGQTFSSTVNMTYSKTSSSSYAGSATSVVNITV